MLKFNLLDGRIGLAGAAGGWARPVTRRLARDLTNAWRERPGVDGGSVACYGLRDWIGGVWCRLGTPGATLAGDTPC